MYPLIKLILIYSYIVTKFCLHVNTLLKMGIMTFCIETKWYLSISFAFHDNFMTNMTQLCSKHYEASMSNGGLVRC